MITDDINLTSSQVAQALHILDQIAKELDRAVGLHKPIHSHHEALSVLWEELEEYKKEVFAKGSDRDYVNIRKELIHLATMCVRTLVDLPEEKTSYGA